jgi:hypothetical protein
VQTITPRQSKPTYIHLQASLNRLHQKNTEKASMRDRGPRTLAGADEEVAVGCDLAVEEVHHRPRVPVAHTRQRHLLLIHPRGLPRNPNPSSS